MAAVLSASVAGAAVAAASSRVAARQPTAPAALRLARPHQQMRSLTCSMQALSVRPSAVVSAAAAEPAEAEVVTEEEPAPNNKEAVATLRYVRGSPNKVRRVLDTIRGRSYEEALMILEYMPYKACEPILKTLVSAASNAKNNYGMRKARLVVSTAYCDMAPPLKRVRARAQGRANKILKKNSHITIKVVEKSA